MSKGKDFLHSHSALERELRLPKHIVLVDKKYSHLFLGEPYSLCKYGGVDYLKVNTLSFVNKGGIFKNLLK